LVLVGTLIDTSVGLLHGINERVDHYLIERGGQAMKRYGRAIVAVSFVMLSLLLSWWGIINLVDKGYGTVAWGFLLVYLVPLFTVGLWQLASRRPPAVTA